MSYTLQSADISQVIKARRTVKPDKMNGRQIPDETIVELLSLADWAPTHKNTEPWRFIVFPHSKVKDFTLRHAELYKMHSEPASFNPGKYEKLKSMGELVSHIIVAWMKRSEKQKVPEIEEIAATCAAIQNLLLAATSKGISVFWSTGGMTLHPVMKAEFNLDVNDLILGVIYLGYSDEPSREGSRLIPLTDKIEWVR